MTPQELMDLATKAAKDAIEVTTKQVDEHITASERIHVRGVSEALSQAALALVANPHP